MSTFVIRNGTIPVYLRLYSKDVIAPTTARLTPVPVYSGCQCVNGREDALPGRELGLLARASLHRWELSWLAAGWATGVTTQDKQNKAPTCWVGMRCFYTCTKYIYIFFLRVGGNMQVEEVQMHNEHSEVDG